MLRTFRRPTYCEGRDCILIRSVEVTRGLLNLIEFGALLLVAIWRGKRARNTSEGITFYCFLNTRFYMAFEGAKWSLDI